MTREHVRISVPPERKEEIIAALFSEFGHRPEAEENPLTITVTDLLYRDIPNPRKFKSAAMTLGAIWCGEWCNPPPLNPSTEIHTLDWPPDWFMTEVPVLE
ncbi:MAG: hypothetical protein ACYC75_03200 [Minisyncoccota bacterium]